MMACSLVLWSCIGRGRGCSARRISAMRMRTNMGTTDLAEMALRYARQGWPIFPVKPHDKQPLTFDGFKSATTDEATITKWWTTWPDANIATVPGRCGMVVLDLDGPEGEGAAQQLG